MRTSFPGCSTACTTRVARLRTVTVRNVSSSQWGFGEQGTAWKGGSQEAVELFVASYEDARKLAHAAKAADVTAHRYQERRKVASPRTGSRFVVPRNPTEQQVAELAVKEQFAHQQQSGKALKAELNVATAELRTKAAELAKLSKVVSHKDREIQELKATVADRDAKIKSSKQDLMESRMMLQDKDNLLQTAYEALTTACKERAELRRQLIEVQSELQETRQELRKWTDEMTQLKSVMDALDSVEPGSLTPALTNAAPSSSADWGEEGFATLLQELTQLTQQVVAEAQEDERLYNQAIGHSGAAALRAGGNAAFW